MLEFSDFSLVRNMYGVTHGDDLYETSFHVSGIDHIHIILCFLAVFESCFDVQKYNNTVIDGEYLLQIRHPTCNQTVQVYCADMGTSRPQECVTLGSGPENSFSGKAFVSSPAENLKNSSETQFARVPL